MDTAHSSNPSLLEMVEGDESRGPHENSTNTTKDREINSREGFKPPQTDPWIRYCVEWRDSDNKFKSRYEVSKHDIDISNLGGDSRRHDDIPAFERVSVFHTKSTTDTASGLKFQGTSTDKGLPISGIVPTYYLRIYSEVIIHALRSVVRYYPRQDLSGDYIDITWPYPVLVHYYDELHSFREAVAKKWAEEVCIRERGADKHLELLLGLLDQEIMEAVRVEKERNKRSCYTFDYLWVSMKPGTTIMTGIRESEDRTIGVIYSVSGGIFTHPRLPWELEMWSMQYNGHYLGRVNESLTWERFDGEREIDWEMFFGGMEDLAEAKKNKEITEAVEEGSFYWNLIDSQCKYHEGPIVDLSKSEVQSLVMVDLNSFYTNLPSFNIGRSARKERVPTLMNQSDHRDFKSDCPCRICKSGKSTEVNRTSIFEGYDKITRKDRRKLTDHQYFLCPKQVHVFVFKTRTWEKVNVRNLSSPRFQKDMIETLVMDPGRLETLKSLTGSFARLNRHGQKLLEKPWAADYVEGKGNGLIFLLHGGPGVGKTLTAECIANFLGRPLMILTTTDIGTKPEDIEENLTRSFKTARSWNAVLLIDEADVFVANRTIKDLYRSSLVASFLRALEFYDGILFLTTNRVGTFDDAILSRVHIQMFYPDLNSEQRQMVWKTFINKLEAEKPSMQVKYAVKEYLRSGEMKDFEMNGREIRNAFQTAVALAEHRAEEGEGGKILLTEEHLREVIELSKSFKKYFSELHGSEGRRAFNRGERLDSFLKALEEDS